MCALVSYGATKSVTLKVEHSTMFRPWCNTTIRSVPLHTRISRLEVSVGGSRA